MIDASKVPNRYCMKALTPTGEWVFWDARHPMNEDVILCTVCMSTGIEDANGVLIYEGDIVEILGSKATVKWKDEFATFVMIEHKRFDELVLSVYTSKNIHVEGNIHER